MSTQPAPAQPRDKASSEPAELAPCPFDGGTADIELYGSSSDHETWCAVCRSCACEGPWAKSEGMAARAWNRRVPPAVVDAGLEAVGELAALRAAVQTLLEAVGATDYLHAERELRRVFSRG